MRGIHAYLQTRDDGTWSTAYTFDTDEIVEGVADNEEEDAYGGSGPDTYPLPDIDAEDTYRICVSFVVRHRGANGCSDQFHTG